MTLKLSRGLNVIYGPNESGKSTLREALMAVLFENPTSQRESVERWTSWGHSERSELKLDYWNDSGQLCQLRKDFADRKIFLMAGEESFKTPKIIQQLIFEELGIASETFYALCASLDSKTLADLGEARRQIGTMLASLMTGAENGTDVLQAIKHLEEDLRELNKGLQAPSKIPGPLKEAKEKVGNFISERRRLEAELVDRQEREHSCEQLSRDLQADELQLKDLEILLMANRKRVEAQKRHEALVQQDQRYEQLKQQHERLLSEWGDLDRQVGADLIAALVPADLEQIREFLFRETQLQAEAESVVGISAKPWWYWVAGANLGLAGLMLIWKWPIPGLVVLLLGALALGLGWRQRQTATRVKHAWEEKQRNRQQRLADLAEERQRWKERAGFFPEEILKCWPGSQQRLAQKNALERRLQESEFVDEEHWKTVRRELRLLQDELNDPISEALLLTPLEMAQRERERQTLTLRVEEKRRSRDRLLALLEHDPAHQDRLLELDEKLAEAKERQAYLEQQARIGQMALDALQQARRATLHPARQILESESGRLLSLISGGRYGQIRVDDEDLTCQVLIPETHHWEDPKVLSQGTYDQLYLSLRLVLGNILAGGKKPPLLMDDPFVTFDQERQTRFWQWLKIRSQEQQILFFTCFPEYHNLADHWIALEPIHLSTPTNGRG